MNNGEIITKDLYLAAILVAYGCSITHVDKSNRKQQFFYFDRLPESVYILDGLVSTQKVTTLTEILAIYLSKKLIFPPTFVDSLRSVKAYLYSE